jgi:hypothetical protein
MRAVAARVGAAVSVGAGVSVGKGVSVGTEVNVGVSGVLVDWRISTCGKACTVTPTVGNGVGPPQAVMNKDTSAISKHLVRIPVIIMEAKREVSNF